MNQSKFNIKNRIQSVRHALDGIKYLLLYEHNARIHFFAALFAVLIGFLLKISPIEWSLISSSIGVVIGFESLNTALEKIADFVSPNKHNSIKIIKDISASAVLFVSIMALVVGGLIFIPKILLLW